MTLTRLFLRNFQRHKTLDLELDPHCTILVGPSGHGKTSVLRSLLWIATNRPQGSSFTRWGTDRILAKLWIDNKTISRIKGRGSNVYKLSGKTLHFGHKSKAPPDEVLELLNLSEVNFQRQLDPHFWLSKTSGQVAKELNAIVNLEVIDSSLAKVSLELKRAKTLMGVSRDRLQEAKKKLDGLSWVKQAQQVLKKLEARDVEIKHQQLYTSTLCSLLQAARQASHKAESSRKAAVAGLALLQRAEKAVSLAQESTQLGKLLLATKNAHKRLATARRAEKQALQKLKETVGNSCPLCNQKLPNPDQLCCS